ncbi:hypothetical protein POF50_027085 [Streptomyces sp. SL13]|uniref:Uncharacterized protein n=1 Tax=Streptantibioticus silvisoli TaxID=2705255 RepID=A0AA90HDL6_9ACTN|nr:hypothetical protein [Streptantibioticus silvisoli]MDI5972967.1 hypothetical protein [Streptantibioticus silvisoli]
MTAAVPPWMPSTAYRGPPARRTTSAPPTGITVAAGRYRAQQLRRAGRRHQQEQHPGDEVADRLDVQPRPEGRVAGDETPSPLQAAFGESVAALGAGRERVEALAGVTWGRCTGWPS